MDDPLVGPHWSMTFLACVMRWGLSSGIVRIIRTPEVPEFLE
jgi:hypothetical protein